jgi:hypothetical protein
MYAKKGNVHGQKSTTYVNRLPGGSGGLSSRIAVPVTSRDWSSCQTGEHVLGVTVSSTAFHPYYKPVTHTCKILYVDYPGSVCLR